MADSRPEAGEDGGVKALVLSFGVIFVAELGDKSQLMALAFAARYRAVPVLVGITAATAVVPLGGRLPERAIRIGAAVGPFAFGAALVAGGLRD